MLQNLGARIAARRHQASLDRGDSPVPSAIIIAGLAVIAVALLVWVFNTATGFMDEAPTDLPALPGGD